MDFIDEFAEEIFEKEQCGMDSRNRNLTSDSNKTTGCALDLPWKQIKQKISKQDS